VTGSLQRRLLLGALAAGAGSVAAGAVRRHHPGGSSRWQRTNYRGRQVELAGGPGVATGLASALAVAGSPGALVATVMAAGLGAYDDLAGHTHARGLRGHARALRNGVVTSGMVKMVGLTAAAVAAAPSRPRRPGGVALDVVLIAGTANLVNLLDLRPGRAAKVVVGFALPLTAARGSAGDVAASAVGVGLALLPADLAEKQMLGDSGANALGAALGWALAAQLRAAVRLSAAAAIVGLTVVSERVSFTELIERQPMLAAFDRWGRRET
jgi:UDP-N-acetylmuramyl pentapeptide phosphotransferase/UDP-N-acetylglucosamine-1-phosphate transferase